MLGSPYQIHVAVPLVVVIVISTLVISRFKKRKTELSQEVRDALYSGGEK